MKTEQDKKHHYRRVFKSDHLGVADLEDYAEEGKNLIFTIKEVNQYELVSNDKNSGVVVAGKRIGANIAFFKEQIKPLVLNATNSKIMKSFANGSSFVEDWKNITVQLYIDPKVKMKGEIVGGVRIRTTQPKMTKEELNSSHPKWGNAKVALSSGNTTIAKILKTYVLTEKSIDELTKDLA